VRFGGAGFFYLGLGILSVLLASLSRAESQNRLWSTRVVSTYTDEATGTPVSRGGAGTLVSIGDRTWLLTASHVSNGTNPVAWLDTPNKERVSLSANTMIYDSLTDLALFKTNLPLEYAVASYDEGAQLFLLRPEWSQESIVYEFADTKLGQMSFRPPIEMPALNLGNSMGRAYQWVFVPPWVKVSVEELNAFQSSMNLVWGSNVRFEKTIRSTLTGLDLVSSARLYPGSSGSSVWTQVSDRRKAHFRQWYLAGITRASHRDLAATHFASSAAIAALVKAALRGASGNQDSNNLEWHYRHGLTYRKNAKELSEIVPVNSPIGGGTSGDGGDSASNEVSNPWEHFQIASGIRDEGAEDTVGFSLQCGANILFLNGSLSFYKLRPGLRTCKSTAVRKGSDLLALFRKRMGLGTDFKNVTFVFSANQQIVLTHEALILKLSDTFSNETIEFQLSRQGETEASNYLPVVAVAGDKGTTFKIEVSSLFFVEPEDVSWFSEDEVRPIGSAVHLAALKHAHSRPYLRFRSAKIRSSMKIGELDQILDFGDCKPFSKSRDVWTCLRI